METSMMDEPQTEEPPEVIEAERSEGASEKVQPVSGSEINPGDFTRVQGLLKSLRLLLNNQIVVQVEEIAGAVSEAGRKFKLGDIEQANQDVSRMYSAFRQKTGQWESQARNLEQQMRMQSAKNPKAISIDTMNRMKSEQTAVRTRIRTAEVQFRRLHQGLDQAFTNRQRQPEPREKAEPQGPTDPTAERPTTSPDTPETFLVPFEAATVVDRPEIVKKWFDIEAVLRVNITHGAKGTNKVRFDPKPPLDRLYFLSTTAQVIRLQQLGRVVLFENLETSQNGEMTLKEFVKHVQSGVWLLSLPFAPRK
jgi:hypothetical protein